MTTREINAAIAAECGLGRRNYAGNLNAMIMAEANLGYEQLLEYTAQLAIGTGQTQNRNNWRYHCFVMIRASVRAEAYLRAVGRWRE